MDRLTREQKQACRDAAEYIAEHGHCKGSYYYWADISFDTIAKNPQYNPPACALGAIAKVTGQNVDDVRREYSEPLGRMVGDKASYCGSGFGIQVFNDREETSAEDVILALKRFGED